MSTPITRARAKLRAVRILDRWMEGSLRGLGTDRVGVKATLLKLPKSCGIYGIKCRSLGVLGVAAVYSEYETPDLRSSRLTIPRLCRRLTSLHLDNQVYRLQNAARLNRESREADGEPQAAAESGEVQTSSLPPLNASF